VAVYLGGLRRRAALLDKAKVDTPKPEHFA
jgi:hypothetical protein